MTTQPMALENPNWRGDAMDTMKRIARSGHPFTANDLRHKVGRPVQKGNMVGTATETRDNCDRGVPGVPTHFVEGPAPKIWNRKGGTEYTEGMIVGRRYVQEGKTHYA